MCERYLGRAGSIVLRLAVVACLLSGAAEGGTASQMSDWFVFPAVASAPGAYGTYFRTDLTVLNASLFRSQTIKVYLLKTDQNNSSTQSATITLAAGEQRVIPDVLQALFSFTGSGALYLDSTDGTYFASSARTYTGTLGTSGFAGTGNSSYMWGTAKALLVGLKNDSVFRTNVGVVSLSDISISLTVSLYGPTGSLLGSRNVTLPPWGRTQFNVDTFAPSFSAAYAVWTGMTPGNEASWIPFATVVDNTSGDSVYIDDLYDNSYSTKNFFFNEQGRWKAVAGSSYGIVNFLANVYQTGARLDVYLYDPDYGARVAYLSGYEDRGNIFLTGSATYLQCLGNTLTFQGTTNGTHLQAAGSGTGCFATPGVIVMDKQYSFSEAPPEAELRAEGPSLSPRRTRPFSMPRDLEAGTP